jgi:3-hydroxyanthranilate 3,4-dioxygenase
MGPGDWAYVPAGTEHRVIIAEEGIQVRYKANRPGLEAAVFRCRSCGGELVSHAWDTAATVSQAEYDRAVRAFNADAGVRACPTCGHRHDAIDLTPFRWADVAATLTPSAVRP